MSRYLDSKKEREYLEQQQTISPELFIKNDLVEDKKLLESVGIILENRLLSEYYIKTFPTDFIVEEKNTKFGQTTINYETLKEPLDCDDTRTLFATLVKCNIQTTDAISEIAKQLGIEEKNISYAGLKDKNAITSQTISIRGVLFKDIKQVSSPYFFIKDAKYGNGIVQMGDLVSNKFTIIVRKKEVTIQEQEKKDIIDLVESIKKNGCKNFYYLQRFSSPRYTNIHWGYLLFQGRFDEAIKLMITQKSSHELLFHQSVRDGLAKIYGNWSQMQKTLEPFTVSFSSEREVIKHLVDNPNDYIGALNKIPEQVRLWVYSVPSYFFNIQLSNTSQQELQRNKKLPLLLSDIDSDINVYKDILVHNDMYPLPRKNLRVFPYIQFKSRNVDTVSKPKDLSVTFVKSQATFSFSLGKGEYATTFLSQVITLVQPSKISTQLIDATFENIPDSNLVTFSYFSDVLSE